MTFRTLLTYSQVSVRNKLRLYLGNLRERFHLEELYVGKKIQGGSNMTGTDCDLFTHKLSRSYLNHLVVLKYKVVQI
jgi:hypothetical protein